MDAVLLFARDQDANVTTNMTPDYSAPNTHGQSIKAIALVFIILAALFVTARCVMKIKSQKYLWWDDYLSIGALVAAIGRVVISFLLVDKFGIGKHIWDIMPKYYADDRNFQWIEDMIYLAGICLAKLSLLVMYITVFRPKTKFVRLCYFMMAVVISYCVIFIFLYAFNCHPEYYSWHFTTQQGLDYNCIEIDNIIIAIGAVNLVTDLILLIMPVPLILKLNLHGKKRIGVLLVFLTGVFVVITTLVRLIIVVQTISETDPSYSSVDEINWLTIELDVAIICGCLPALAPLYAKLLTTDTFLSSWRSLLNRSRGTRTGKSSGSSKGDGKLSSSSHKSSEDDIHLRGMDKTAHSYTTVHNDNTMTSVPDGRIGMQQSFQQYSTRSDGSMV